ncbi:MAG TPA: hypothetical protein VNI78_06910, partial [Vicinamibacterales bacterium]|nr:hypothetical protein [Vicinamibacterales bacterium]
MDPADLERLIGNELRNLPAPRAPETLLPRVMAAVDAASRSSGRAAWYRRPWRDWPLGWQAASGALAAVILSIGVLALPADPAAAVLSAAASSRMVAETTALAARVEETTSALWVVWRVLLQPFVPYAFGIALLMCLACVAFGVALNYIAFGRTLHR